MKIVTTFLALSFTPLAFAEANFRKVEAARDKCVMESRSTETIMACVKLANRQTEEVIAEMSQVLRKAIDGIGKKQPKLAQEALRRIETEERAWPTYLEAVCRLSSVKKLGMDSEAVEYEDCVFRYLKVRMGTLFSLYWK